MIPSKHNPGRIGGPALAANPPLKSLLLTGLLLLAATPAHGASLQPGDLVAICGDSITEQKRYTVFVEEYLLMCQPVPDVQVMQMGWNGETARGFIARMENDALAFKPTVVTTCYGMNDSGTDPITQAARDDYRNFTGGIADKFTAGGVRWLVIGSPGAVDPASYTKSPVEIRNANLAALRDEAREVAASHHADFANVHDLMEETMARARAKYGADYKIGGTDGVHPNYSGHLIMAYAFLKAMGMDGEIGVITYDLGSGQATATAGHRVLSAGSGALELESARYPFCFAPLTGNPGSTRDMLEFLPFNQDLNRFILKVDHAPAGKLEVTWGDQKKVFNSADLEKGINLATEFLDNPFLAQFTKVETAIRKKQEFETLAVKSIQHSLTGWRLNFPEDEADYVKQTEHLIAKMAELRARTQAEIKPITHKITIRPLPE